MTASTSLTLSAQAVRNMVVVDGDQIMTNSRMVAEVFGKQHKDVLKAYSNLECSDEFSRRNFAPRDYMDSRGKAQPHVDMTFEGFTFLAMGFTGAAAAQFKEAFIGEFMRMRHALAAQQENTHIKQLEAKAAFFEKHARLPVLALTDETRSRIAQMLGEGFSVADIARLCRASQKTVRILRDAHVPTAQGKLELVTA